MFTFARAKREGRAITNRINVHRHIELTAVPIYRDKKESNKIDRLKLKAILCLKKRYASINNIR